MSHILVLDIGKTNKKAFVFDEGYRIVFEKTTTLPETTDDDGFPCEDVHLLKKWVLDTLHGGIPSEQGLCIKAINCTAYGASLVHLDENFEPVAPLYNYLKPFPADLKKQFFDTYGSEEKMALETSSPVLGFLNSGLQLYWLKYRKPLIYNKIRWSLHLPQYIAFLIGSTIGPLEIESDKARYLANEVTSLGCHTMLWDFHKILGQRWAREEGICKKFPLIKPPTHTFSHPRFPSLRTGIGLHDSSAALIPYQASFQEPFVLLSTGTWCISLNLFNRWPLTPEELAQDCLFYCSYIGSPVKAARYFGGYEHEQAVKKMAQAFGVATDFFTKTDLSGIPALAEEYRLFMRQLVDKQVVSTKLSIGKTDVRCIFVDGGFSKNEIFMSLLAQAFPDQEVFAAEVPQATALGAALVLHGHWNPSPLPQNLVQLKKYGS